MKKISLLSMITINAVLATVFIVGIIVNISVTDKHNLMSNEFKEIYDSHYYTDVSEYLAKKDIDFITERAYISLDKITDNLCIIKVKSDQVWLVTSNEASAIIGGIIEGETIESIGSRLGVRSFRDV